MSTEIILSQDELNMAEMEATRRQSENEARGLRGRNKAPEKGEKALKMHLLGCVGEIAVAKYLGLQRHVFASKTAVRGSADLPGNIEVKSRSKHGYDLLIQLSDDPSKIFVLVTHEEGNLVKIVGWTYGRDSMRTEWVREFVRGRPCYAIPQKELNPIESITELVKMPAITDSTIERIDGWMVKLNKNTGLSLSAKTLAKLEWKAGDMLKCEYSPQHGYILKKAK